jgi:outer membrane protein assembly factor BamB
MRGLILGLLIGLVGCMAQGTHIPDETPVQWTIPINGFDTTILSSNLLVGFSNVYRDLLSVDVTKSGIAWKVKLEESGFFTYSQLGSNSEAIFVHIPIKGLYIYSMAGELLSKTPLPDSVKNSEYPYGIYDANPKSNQQILYLPIDNFLFAYDVSDLRQPKLLWEREFIARLSSLAVDEQGGVYVGLALYTGLDVVQSINPNNGQTIWSNDAVQPEYPTTLVVVGDKVITAILGSYTIQAFDRTTGEALYVSEDLSVLCPDGQGTIKNFEVAEGSLYVSPESGTCVYAINADTGKVLWTHTSQIDPNTNFTYGGKPKYVNGVVYASNSALWALDAKTGEVLSISSNRDDDALFTNVQYANGEILVWGKNLTAYKPIR